MKKFIFPLGLAAMLTVSCSDDTTSPEIDDSQKTPIMLSSTDNTAKTSYSFDGNTRAGFASTNTSIVMRMVATDGSKYKSTRVTAKAEQDKALDANGNPTKYSDVVLNSPRYWDDAFGRKTKLSIYAVAVPNKDGVTADQLSGGDTWATETSGEVNNNITWTVSENQNEEDVIAKEDLVYSNNIQYNTTQTSPIAEYYDIKNGVYRWDFTTGAYPTFDGSNFSVLKSGEMLFTYKDASVTDGPGKFDTGNLNFLHALSRITLKVKADRTSGFSNPLPEFADVKLFDMPYTGTLNLKTGLFDTSTDYAAASCKDIFMRKLSAETGIDAQYMAQVLPGYTINKDEDLKNVLQFKIGDNIYYISQKKVYEALDASAERDKLAKNGDGDIVMAQGQSFVLTVTVKKTGIENLTATLADWTEISGSTERNNAYLTFNFSQYGETKSTDFTLYRSATRYTDYVTNENYTPRYDWDKGFAGNAADLTQTGDVWSTKWYWDDNKTFYHFRTVGNDNRVARTIASDATTGLEYFDIKAGATDGNYQWGAPFASGKSLAYDRKGDNGFDVSATDHHLSQAIGATESTLKLTEVNMLSHIRVKVTTSASTEPDKVTLYDANKADGKMTRVYLTHIYTNGKVYMGNGRVVPTGNRVTDAGKVEMTQPTAEGVTAYDLKNPFDYFVVPQELIDGDTKVGLEIRTPDDNIYFVVARLADITATRQSQGDDKNPELGQQKDDKITYWYPNCIYNYTIKVTKTGIKAITCTLADWTVINGNNQNIGLED